MTEHIAKQFDVELNELQTNMLEMGADVRRQLDAVGRVLLRLDEEEAREVEAADQRINMKEKELDAFIEFILAHRQPQARDLRLVVSSLRMTIDFERMGDEVRSAAKGVRKLRGTVDERLVEMRDELLTLHAHLLVMMDETLTAVKNFDDRLAHAVVARFPVLRKETGAAVKAVVDRMVAGAGIEDGLELIRIAKARERVGAHMQNIGESIVFIREGVDIRHTPETEGKTVKGT